MHPCLPQWREEWRDMADNVKRLPAENIRYHVVDGMEMDDAMVGELSTPYSYDSLKEAEEAAANLPYEVTILEVKVKPVSVTRKVTEVERL